MTKIEPYVIKDTEQNFVECDCGHIVDNFIEHTFWFEDDNGKDFRLCKKCMLKYCAIEKLQRSIDKSYDN